jgi:hypothetical protein
MARQKAAHTVMLMNRLARTAELMHIAPHVYGAALAASRDERAAADVTEGVFSKAAGEDVIDRERLVERAILMGCAASRPPASPACPTVVTVWSAHHIPSHTVGKV